ncbi:MAG: SCP2 sterol-binding domain-containing protein [Burkholderiales bacterium]|nr:SCP2 sterol-binding domain-containing protein [Burkholderiales bacterium]
MNAGDRQSRIPWPLGTLLARLPQTPPSAALATALNFGLKRGLEPEALERLSGRIVRLVVRDAGLRLTLSFDGRYFRARPSAARADVTITASTHDFALLALRREDPDTLFFARRLTMEGDTELGLVVRNMLDAVDTSMLTERIERGLAFLRRLRAHLPSH